MRHGAGQDAAELTPHLLLRAYSVGVFPMAEARDDDEMFWVDPHWRGIFPLDAFHISRSLARAMRRPDYRVTFDQDFAGVVAACAERPETWINLEIERLYNALHDEGHAHSIEILDLDGQLIGGVYGVTLGRAFFGESMFSRRRDASKIALAFLVDHLRRAGFTLFDTQFLTPHLASLGAVEVSRKKYHELLSDALDGVADYSSPEVSSAGGVLQRNTQMS